MKKIKVLQFTIAQSKGGRTQYILNNWRAIDKSRFSFDFVTFSERLDFEEELLRSGCNVFHISCYYRDNPDQFVKEFDKIIKHGYDVIHIHTSYWEDAIVEERAKAFGIKKIIIHAHNSGISKALNAEQLEEKTQLHYQVREKIDFDIPTDFCACSQEAAFWLYGNKISPERINILHNAIDTKKYAYCLSARRRIRSELGLDDNTIVLGVIGRLVYQKNQELLIRIMSQLIGDYRVKLVLVGDGERKNELESMAIDYGVEKDVMFLGYRNDVAEVLQAIDILCMPSRYEGLPITLIEAQCSNLICLVSECVSAEARIVETVISIPLIDEKWESYIQSLIEKKEYLNRKTREEIKDMGYEIDYQVKLLESLYGE